MQQERNFIDDFRSGDPATWKELMNTAKNQSLIFLALNITKNKEDAENQIFSAFASLWEKRDKFNEKDEIRAYLYVTVRNNCLQFLKTEQKHAKYIRQFPILERLGQIDEVHQLKIANFFKHVVPYFELLPDQSRQILKLYFVDGLSDSDIAERLDTTINTVHSQKSKGLKKVRELLLDNEPGLDFLSFYLLIHLFTDTFFGDNTLF